jgi:type IV pilus assembly protein PilY1
MIRDRFYSIYDDSSVIATLLPNTNVPVSSVPYTENSLVNLSLDELGAGSSLTDAEKDTIRGYLTDDVTYAAGALEYGSLHEDDAKGWYIILEDQGAAIHHGEKVLSAADLYAQVLYFTSYRPSITDPCNPQGTGFAYSLNYCDATAAYAHGRYYKAENIHGIPSDFSIVTRDGQAGAMSMMGGKVVGAEKQDNFKIKGSGYGLELYYWRESDSRK